MISHKFRTFTFGFLTLFVLTSFFKVFSQEKEPSFRDPQPYLIGVNDDYKFVWFRVAKAGTTTIRNIFSKNKVEFSTYNQEPQFYNLKNYKNYFKFAFVRNPWDRVVSCYFQKVVNKNPAFQHYYGECFDKNFEYFVNFIAKKDLLHADRHIRPQSSLIPVHDVDFIGRLETFSQDLSYVLSVIDIPDQEIPKKNATAHKHYSEYYNERTKQIIADKYKDDIEAFGYEFEYE